MFVRSTRQNRFQSRLVVVACAAIAILVTACAPGQAQPTDYGLEGELFYNNFMIGCTNTEPDEDGNFTEADAEELAFCGCLFKGLKDRVPFADAMSYEESMADIEEDESFEVPAQIMSVMNSCDNADGATNNAGDSSSDDAASEEAESGDSAPGDSESGDSESDESASSNGETNGDTTNEATGSTD